MENFSRLEMAGAENFKQTPLASIVLSAFHWSLVVRSENNKLRNGWNISQNEKEGTDWYLDISYLPWYFHKYQIRIRKLGSVGHFFTRYSLSLFAEWIRFDFIILGFQDFIYCWENQPFIIFIANTSRILSLHWTQHIGKYQQVY